MGLKEPRKIVKKKCSAHRLSFISQYSKGSDPTFKLKFPRASLSLFLHPSPFLFTGKGHSAAPTSPWEEGLSQSELAQQGAFYDTGSAAQQEPSGRQAPSSPGETLLDSHHHPPP